jgi:hypothetical protein
MDDTSGSYDGSVSALFNAFDMANLAGYRFPQASKILRALD